MSEQTRSWVANGRLPITSFSLLILIAVLSCTGCSPSPSDDSDEHVWTATEAIAHLSEQLYIADKERVEAEGEIGARLIATGSRPAPSRRPTKEWSAEQDVDASWLVRTKLATYRVFENQTPFALVELHSAPTPIARVTSTPWPTATAFPTEKSRVGTLENPTYGLLQVENCKSPARFNYDINLGGGVRGVVVGSQYHCKPELGLVELDEGGRYWFALRDLFVEK